MLIIINTKLFTLVIMVDNVGLGINCVTVHIAQCINQLTKIHNNF